MRGILGPGADVQEVLQEAFLRVWKARDGRLEVRDPVAWIFVVTMNLAKDLRRRRQRREAHVPVVEVDPVELKTSRQEPLGELERGEWLQAARSAIVQLADPEKEVFVLRTSGGRTFAAIAESLGIPVGTAKTRMRSALRHLRERLAAFAPELPSGFEPGEGKR